ncbi:MAG: hypothetical protein ACPH5P_00165 [Akkermansiaceae bacterium]
MCGRFNTTTNFPAPYAWTEPDGTTLRPVRNISQLLHFISSHRTHHGGDLAPGWEHRVCNQLCEQPELESCCSPGDGTYTRKVSVMDIKRFALTATRWVAEGGKLVDSDTAHQRASVCASCPENVKASGCLGCSAVVPKLLKLLNGNTTSYDEQLKACNVCGCQLQAKVWMPAEVMSEGAEGFPDHCWIKQEQTS